MQISFKAQLKNATERIIEGFATTDSLDDNGDKFPLDVIIAAFERLGKSLKICGNHGYNDFGRVNVIGCNAIGHLVSWSVSANGVYISVKITDPKVWDDVVKGRYGGFSIGGFRLVDKKSGVIKFLGIEEISLVGAPTNGDCFFVTAKGYIMDEEYKALLEAILGEMQKMNKAGAAGDDGEGNMDCNSCTKMQVAKGNVAPTAQAEIKSMKDEIAGLKTGIEEIKLMMNAAMVAKGVAFDQTKEPQKTDGARKMSEVSFAEMQKMSKQQIDALINDLE